MATPLQTQRTNRDLPAKGHLPRSVWNMAFTELWERFSFYGLQGILTFYLLYSLDKGGMALDPLIASSIVGAYGGSVYLAQLLGAWLGDRLISPRVMVLLGGIVITAGHLALAFLEGFPGLMAGLALIVLGTGALKTNITSIVGYIMDSSPDTRDVGFSYFYMAINIGAVIGPLSTGFVQNQFGFHLGFGLAAVGMVGALVQYAVSMKKLPSKASTVNNRLPRNNYYVPLLALLLTGSAAFLAVISGSVNPSNLATVVTLIALAAALAYFIVMLTSKTVSTPEKKRVLGFFPLFLISGIYFGFLFQKFTAVSILITKRVNLDMGDWTFPVAWITTVSPLAAVLITPLISRLWTRLSHRQPSPVTKFAIGMMQIGCAYLFILLVASSTGDAQIPLLLILLFMMIAGSSEVFVGPIGLSLATRIGPKTFKSQMVGLNFLTLALGSSLSGLLGQLFTKIENTTYFTLIATAGVVLGMTLLATRKPINRLLTSDA
ncbi:peptide MFS transporter [Paenarthrobacter nicotinovorans]|nr:oligopeptide:H+ symporter [Paenarthrobacter nicotinovorans]